MSVASDITALTTKLSTIFDQIKTALAAKGVSGVPADYAAVPAKITSIVTGTGIDTSDATATAGDIRSGKTAYADGVKVTGSLVPGTDTSDANAAAGDIRTGKTAYVNGTKLSGELNPGTDTTDATAAAGDIKSGKTAYVNGVKVTGNIPTVNHVIPTISVNTSTGRIQAEHRQSTGYVVGSNLSTVQDLSTIAATTYYPSTSDQTIASGKFLTGAQTIKGDSDLKASNIKSGVTIFNVTGTYEGSVELESSSAYYNTSRTGAKAMTFSGISVPSGYKLVGLAGANGDDPDANHEIQTFVVFGSEMGGIGFIQDRSNTGTMDVTTAITFTATGGGGSLTISSSSSFGFMPGTYSIKPIFAVS